MAARKRPLCDEKTRLKIQTTQLLKRLEKHALEGLDLDQGRIKAIEILLKKTLPDLSAVKHSSDEDNPVRIQHEVKWTVCDPQAKKSLDD